MEIAAKFEATVPVAHSLLLLVCLGIFLCSLANSSHGIGFAHINQQITILA